MLFLSLFIICFLLAAFSQIIVFASVFKKPVDTSYLHNFSNLYTKVFKAIPISPQRKDIHLSLLSWNGLIWNLKRIVWNFSGSSGIEVQVINKFPLCLFNPLPL